MGVGSDDIAVRQRQDWKCPKGRSKRIGDHHEDTSTIGSARTDPLVPFGTRPQVPARLGFIDSNHDEANTSNGGVDLPF